MDETTAVFKIQGPGLDREEFTVGQSGARAGRSGDNDIVLPSNEISRHHMRFEWIDNQIAIRDLNSSNGVWYNDARIRADAPQVLQPGESIRVGPFVITLDTILVPKKRKGHAQQTLEDVPVAKPPEPEPPPVEPYIPETIPPIQPEPEAIVEAAPPASEPIAEPPPVVEDDQPVVDANLEKEDMEFAVAAPGQEVPIEPEPEPEQPERSTKSRKSGKGAKDEVEAPPVESESDEKSFLFTPVEPVIPERSAAAKKETPTEKSDEASLPAIVPEKPKAESKPVEAKPTKSKSDDPFDHVPFIGGDGASLSPAEPLPPLPTLNGTAFPVGIPKDASSWLKYLPSIYLDDGFTGRFLLIFEAMMSPDIWIIDNLDLYFSPDIAPLEWVRWLASWFDIYIAPELPAERQRAILDQAGWLAARRGTRIGLERLLELYCGVRPEIIEEAAHFTVKLALSESNVSLTRELLEILITKNKPAFASFSLELS